MFDEETTYKSGVAPEGSTGMMTQTVGLLGWTRQALLHRLDFERGPLPRVHLTLMSLALQSGDAISVLPQIVYDVGDVGLDEGQWEVRELHDLEKTLHFSLGPEGIILIPIQDHWRFYYAFSTVSDM